MGLFDFVGTFFFMSLGITFVLILLLVYHFKQRLTDMEQKGDKMFEIVNTIVKEMGNMRRAISQYAYVGGDQSGYHIHNLPKADSDDDECDNEDNENGYSDNEGDSTNHCALHNKAMYGIHGYNEDHTHAHKNDNDDDHNTNDMIVAQHLREISIREDSRNDPNILLVKDMSTYDGNFQDQDKAQIKVVNVDLTYDEEDIRTDSEGDGDADLNGNMVDAVEVLMDVEEVPELHTQIGEDLIHVSKLDETVLEQESIVSEEKTPYSKMTLPQLRAYAVSNGLLSDASKMKKADLIKLLEANE